MCLFLFPAADVNCFIWCSLLARGTRSKRQSLEKIYRASHVIIFKQTKGTERGKKTIVMFKCKKKNKSLKMKPRCLFSDFNFDSGYFCGGCC